MQHHINRIIVAILVSGILACSNQTNLPISVSPKNFKVQIPFMLDARGIIINTYWGSGKKHYVLCLDNYSPSWVKRSVIAYDKSFSKSTGPGFKTATADGSPITGDVGICDSLSFENITFKKVPFYVMPNEFKDSKNDDGVFGGDLMSTGIWKIDFKKEELTFASSIDSLKEINQAELFPAVFDHQSVKIDVKFGANIEKMMAIDLGYNGDLLMPPEEFNDVNRQSKALLRPAMFHTPAGENMVNNLSFFDTVNINHNWFFTIVSSNNKVKERLIGLQFFRRFDFVIFDFINRHVYIPKKVW